MKEKILTVSIAAYNAEQFLEKCVRSVLESENKEVIEILIIDDGSTDKTPEISDELVRNNPDIIRVIHKSNGGWGSTVNQAIDNAKGKYLRLLDADDCLDSKELDMLIKTIEEKKIDSDIIFCNYKEVNANTKKLLRRRKVFSDDYFINMHKNYGVEYSIEELPGSFYMPMHSMFVKNNILKGNNVNLLENCYYTDIEFTLKSLAYSKNFIIFDYSIYLYYLEREGQSVSVSGVRKHYKNHLKSLKRNLEFVSSMEESKLKTIISSRVRMMVESQWDMFWVLEKSQEHCTEMKEFDRFLKNKYAEYYPTMNKKTKVWRVFGVLAYGAISRYNLSKS